MNDLTFEEQRDLLALARASVHDTVHGERSVEALIEQLQVTAELDRPRGAFVSLKLPSKKEGGERQLRGCIGTIAATRPLYRNVVHVAAQAAGADPRFAPVGVEELSALHVEVSALTPLTEVAGPEEIQPGLHGVQLSKGSAGAVFLPQVARERGWSVEQLLTQLSIKAGLPRDGWVGGTLSVFCAEVFGDP